MTAEPTIKPVSFQDFALPKPLMQALADLEFTNCTQIQAEALPITLAGYDLIGKAQTGTGKTAAFLLSVMTDLLENPLQEQYVGEPRSLILAPTRELALQIAADAEQLAKHAKLKVLSLVGGMDFDKQQSQLQTQKIDLLVATPGRLIDFVRRKAAFLDQVEVLVIDEADRMLDMGFIPDLRTIIRATPRKELRQTLMFSATFSDNIMRLAQSWTRDARKVEIEPKVKTSDRVEQHIYITTADEKYPLLLSILRAPDLELGIVFANRRDLVRDLTERLRRDGVDCVMLSGEVAQDKRVKTLDRFKSGKVKVMVATDVAGRGIHVDGISHVINFTLPDDPEDYVHRIGRTGRAGSRGLSVSFACEDDSFLIPELEHYLNRKIELERPPLDLLENGIALIGDKTVAQPVVEAAQLAAEQAADQLVAAPAELDAAPAESDDELQQQVKEQLLAQLAPEAISDQPKEAEAAVSSEPTVMEMPAVQEKADQPEAVVESVELTPAQPEQVEQSSAQAEAESAASEPEALSSEQLSSPQQAPEVVVSQPENAEPSTAPGEQSAEAVQAEAVQAEAVQAGLELDKASEQQAPAQGPKSSA